jgi:NCAIR mutase (PurE)-related protein
VDTHRELRQGAPEAVLAEGKAPEEIERIVAALFGAGAGSVIGHARRGGGTGGPSAAPLGRFLLA